MSGPRAHSDWQELVLVLAELMILLSLWALALERAVAACRLGPSEKSTKVRLVQTLWFSNL